jgi:hypothetical protein
MKQKVNVLEVLSKISQVTADINVGAQLFNRLAEKYEGKEIRFEDIVGDIMPEIAKELVVWKKYTNEKGDAFIDRIVNLMT